MRGNLYINDAQLTTEGAALIPISSIAVHSVAQYGSPVLAISRDRPSSYPQYQIIRPPALAYVHFKV